MVNLYCENHRLPAQDLYSTVGSLVANTSTRHTLPRHRPPCHGLWSTENQHHHHDRHLRSWFWSPSGRERKQRIYPPPADTTQSSLWNFWTASRWIALSRTLIQSYLGKPPIHWDSASGCPCSYRFGHPLHPLTISRPGELQHFSTQLAGVGSGSSVWAVLWDVLLFFLFLVLSFGKAGSFTLIRQHSVQRQAEDMRWWGISKGNFPVKDRRHAVLGVNLKSIFQEKCIKMQCWIEGAVGGQKNTQQPWWTIFKIIYQNLMQFIYSSFSKTDTLKRHHATSKKFVLASKAFGELLVS